MANYNEEQISGAQWQRCCSINITNPYKKPAHITMIEETVADVGGETYAKHAAGLSFPFDPDEVIEVLNPETGTPTGDAVSGADVYAYLYSLYIKRANERDAKALDADELPPAV